MRWLKVQRVRGRGNKFKKTTTKPQKCLVGTRYAGMKEPEMRVYVTVFVSKRMHVTNKLQFSKNMQIN